MDRYGGAEGWWWVKESEGCAGAAEAPTLEPVAPPLFGGEIGEEEGGHVRETDP